MLLNYCNFFFTDAPVFKKIMSVLWRNTNKTGCLAEDLMKHTCTHIHTNTQTHATERKQTQA